MAATSDPRFKDPRWIAFRTEALERFDYRCQECCGTEEVAIYISHWEKDKAPWSFHPSSYHCLCAHHGNRRKELEDFIRATLSRFTVLELEPLCNTLNRLAYVESGRRWIAEMMYPMVKQLELEHEAAMQRESERD
jgi:hypothetical protein